MNASQIVTAIAYLIIMAILGYLVIIWAWPLIAKGLYFGAMFAFFMVWVIWCVLKP